MTRKLWRPLERVPTNPHYLDTLRAAGEDFSKITLEVWANDHYQVTARIHPDGFTHLSCKREDRYPIHDWRQLQQIKNQICGEDRWAVEIYPPEEFVVDTSNEYHLWVMPPGHDVPFAFHERELMTKEQIEEFNRSHEIIDRKGERTLGKARQRAWQPGLTTGLGEGQPAGGDDDALA
jgi:hypothetical protein